MVTRTRSVRRFQSVLWRLALAAIPLLLACHPPPVLPTDPVAIARQRLADAPRDPAVYLDLVRLSIERQDFVRATQYLSLAEHSPLAEQQSEPLFRLGLTIAVRSQNYSDGIRRCQAGLQRKETMELRRLLATLFEAHGEIIESERQHAVILELYPAATEQLVETARFYERSELPDRVTQARALYERYLKLAPTGAVAEQVRAALLLNQHSHSSR